MIKQLPPDIDLTGSSNTPSPENSAEQGILRILNQQDLDPWFDAGNTLEKVFEGEGQNKNG